MSSPPSGRVFAQVGSHGYHPVMANAERGILESAVHTVSEQASKASALVGLHFSAGLLRVEVPLVLLMLLRAELREGIGGGLGVEAAVGVLHGRSIGQTSLGRKRFFAFLESFFG